MSEMVERVMLALSNAGLDDVNEEDARAAIEAMREPTPDMVDAAKHGAVNSLWIGASYTKMIDAALKEPTT